MILVTGATGNVGAQLTRQLLDAGQAVRILTRDAARAEAWRGQAEIFEGDLNDLAAVRAGLDGISGLFLVTGDTQQDENVLTASAERHVEHIVKLSTLEAVDPKMADHVRWHRRREALIAESGIAWTFLRPTMFMSTALSWSETIRSRGAFYFAAGDGRVPAVDPWDVAAVAAVALTTSGHEGHAYSLTGPESLSFGDMARILSDVLGKRIEYVDISNREAADQMRAQGLPDYVVTGLVKTLAAVREGRLEACSGDVELVIGRKPRSFRRWCQENLAAFR